MNINAFKIDMLKPPQDDLLSKIKTSDLTLEGHDVIALSSKVVSIWQGRCVLKEGTDKDELTRREAGLFLERSETPGSVVMHTITNGTLIPSAGIDPFGEYYILWPENPMAAAEELLDWFKKTYARENLYLVITDSRSQPLRQGVTGFAIGWAGFSPLYDERDRKDLLGVASGGSQVNLPDSIASAATLAMGEGNEQTPLVRLRDVKYLKNDRIIQSPNLGHEDFIIAREKDIFAPFLKNVPWKKGEGKGGFSARE